MFVRCGESNTQFYNNHFWGNVIYILRMALRWFCSRRFFFLITTIFCTQTSFAVTSPHECYYPEKNNSKHIAIQKYEDMSKY